MENFSLTTDQLSTFENSSRTSIQKSASYSSDIPPVFHERSPGVPSSTTFASGLLERTLLPTHVLYSVFLLFVTIFGTIGNIMTIVAVKIERKLREAVANYFIVNLAFADFMVCGVVVPIVMVHNFLAENLLDNMLCYISAAISGIACHTAAVTMTFIALNRYIAARRSVDYQRIVTKKRVCLVIIFCWLFAIANTIPILLAWLQVDYNPAKYVCVCFDGTFPLQYTLGPVFIGHFLPHAITIFCYARILRALGKSRSKIEKSRASSNVTMTVTSESGHNTRQSAFIEPNSTLAVDGKQTGFSVRNWSSHEIQMFRTSMWIIIFFSFCWIPYGILVLLQDVAPIQLKKTFAALCLMSFSLNPLIYGVLSRSFRRAYKRILRQVFFCCSWKNSHVLRTNKTSRTTTGFALSSDLGSTANKNVSSSVYNTENA